MMLQSPRSRVSVGVPWPVGTRAQQKARARRLFRRANLPVEESAYVDTRTEVYLWRVGYHVHLSRPALRRVARTNGLRIVRGLSNGVPTALLVPPIKALRGLLRRR